MPGDKKMTELEYHPISIHFPLLNDTELKEMADDIKKGGLQNPIMLYEGKILDGRNRYLACKMADVNPRFENYNGNDPLGFVFSLNIQRRNLTVSQRAGLATQFANMRRGERTDISAIQHRVTIPEVDNGLNVDKPISLQEAADLAGVSRSMVVRANRVLKGEPEKFKEIINGKQTIGEALREIKQESTPPAKRETSPDNLFSAKVIKERTKAFEHANRAITELKQIPRSGGCRTEAYLFVKDYITANM